MANYASDDNLKSSFLPCCWLLNPKPIFGKRELKIFVVIGRTLFAISEYGSISECSHRQGLSTFNLTLRQCASPHPRTNMFAQILTHIFAYKNLLNPE